MTQNQFFDFMKPFLNNDLYLNQMKQMGAYIDMASFANTVMENAEAARKVNQKVASQVQNITKRFAEIVQNNMIGIFDLAKDSMNSSGDLEHVVYNQQRYFKSAYEEAMNNTKEITDLFSKSVAEVVDSVSQNINANNKK